LIVVSAARAIIGDGRRAFEEQRREIPQIQEAANIFRAKLPESRITVGGSGYPVARQRSGLGT